MSKPVDETLTPEQARRLIDEGNQLADKIAHQFKRMHAPYSEADELREELRVVTSERDRLPALEVDRDECCHAMEKKLGAVIAMLTDLEHNSVRHQSLDYIECPVCEHSKPGHYDGCALGAALLKASGR